MNAKVKSIKARKVLENPYRPNYEKSAMIGWGVGLVGSVGAALSTSLPTAPIWAIAGMSSLMMLARLPSAIRLNSLQKHLAGKKLAFIDTLELFEQTQKNPTKIWMGKGFVWEKDHTQRVHQLLTRNISDYIQTDDTVMGSPWLHGIEPEETDLYQELAHAGLHSLVAGATGSGKTRLADLMISQAIWRGETVIILDPKGDKDTQKNAKQACELMGRGDKYVSFHPAFADTSHRINPLQNYVRLTELGGRVVAKMPGDGDGAAFKAFAQGAVNSVVQGFNLIGERPSISKIKSALEGGLPKLIAKAIRAYSESVIGEDETNRLILGLDMSNDVKAMLNLIKMYREAVAVVKPNNDLEGLISMGEHDKAHFGKMIATLLPLLTMLTSGEIGPLLSPDPDDPTDLRPITSSLDIIENQQVAYIGLDSLSDQMVGQAIGSMILADITSVAGKRYNYDQNPKPINLFIDEAAEIANDQLIQILNKARGAGFRVTIFTQSISDFEAGMGSPAKMNQVLDNVNNTITLRITGNDTQEYFATNLPEITITSIQNSIGMSTKEDPMHYGGNVGQRTTDERVPLVAPQWLGMLANLEMFCKLSGGRFLKARIPILQPTDMTDPKNQKKLAAIQKKYKLGQQELI